MHMLFVCRAIMPGCCQACGVAYASGAFARLAVRIVALVAACSTGLTHNLQYKAHQQHTVCGACIMQKAGPGTAMRLFKALHPLFPPDAGLAPVYAPTLVKALEGKGVAAVRSGQHHTLVLTQEGEEWCSCKCVLMCSNVSSLVPNTQCPSFFGPANAYFAPPTAPLPAGPLRSRSGSACATIIRTGVGRRPSLQRPHPPAPWLLLSCKGLVPAHASCSLCAHSPRSPAFPQAPCCPLAGPPMGGWGRKMRRWAAMRPAANPSRWTAWRVSRWPAQRRAWQCQVGAARGDGEGCGAQSANGREGGTVLVDRACMCVRDSGGSCCRAGAPRPPAHIAQDRSQLV